MQYSTHEIEQAKIEFKKTKLKTRLLVVPIQIVICIFLVIRIFFKEAFTQYIENNTIFSIRLDMIFAIVGGITLLLSIISIFVWKCPHCHKRFGKAKNFKHCMYCGIELED